MDEAALWLFVLAKNSAYDELAVYKKTKLTLSMILFLKEHSLKRRV